MKKIIMMFFLVLVFCGCGKSGSYEAITFSGNTITVPASVLPAKIPSKFSIGKAQAVNMQMPSFLMWIKSTPIRGGGNILVLDDNGNTIALTCRVEESGFVENFLFSRSVSADAAAVKMKGPDDFFVTFVPVDSKGVSWKKGLYAVAFQMLESREIRVAYIDQKMLLKLGKGIGYPKIMSSIADAIKQLEESRKGQK